VISYRYHLVSIIGIFLAIALGVVIGTTALNGAVVGDLRRQVTDLKQANSTSSAQNKALQAQAGNADLLARSFVSKLAGTALVNRTVVVLGAPGASSKLSDSVAKEVVAAGGKVGARLQLSKDFANPKRAVDIRALATSGAHPVGLQLPSTDDAGRLAGALLGYVLFGHGQSTDLTQVLTGFGTLNMIKTLGSSVVAGNVVLLVAPGGLPADDSSAPALLSMTTQLGTSGGSTVVLGDTPSASQHGLVALVRGDDAAQQAVSTVDDVDTDLGQLTTVLVASEAIARRNGQYGTSLGASSLMPGVSE
jgi:hypothetical protein